MIDLISVASSNLARIGYSPDPDTPVLRVVFHSSLKNGTAYDYLGVPPHVWEAFLASSSKGTFFDQHIKGHYQFQKVHLALGAA